jgi:Putative bacterial sensory transduction regulator
MTKTQIYLDYLREEGYRPELDKDGDVVFKHERVTFIIFANEDDEQYFKMMIPYFWELETAEETDRAMRVMMRLNREYKAAKFCETGEDVSLFVECFYETADGFKSVFARYVDLLSSALREFRQLMQEETPQARPIAQA